MRYQNSDRQKGSAIWTRTMIKRALLGCPLDKLLRFGGPLGTPLVTILVSWGALWRSHGSLGATLLVILMVFMSKPSSGHNFDGFDDQIPKRQYSNTSHLRLPSLLHVSLASVMCTSPLRL